MDNLETLRELFAHMEWADAKIWTAVLACPAAGMDANLKERLHHIHMVQRGFLMVWQGVTAFEPSEGANFPDLQALLAWAREGYGKFNEYVSDLGRLDFERPIVMPWIEMFEERMGRRADAPTFHETMLQVAMHSAYHRGQVATKLREIGGEPPLTDFIVWIWLGKPQPDWPRGQS